MSQSEVFRPSNGQPLLVRGSITDGAPEPADRYAKDGSRPATNGGYRFGQLSRSSFFARHNPHPARVKHLKGLLDVPICSVHDDGYFANPRYSLQFPPNNFDQTKVKSYSKYYTGNLPVNAINVNSQLHPIDTITGLQYFMGKPLNMRVFREKAVPQVGMVPTTDAWRDELKALTDAIGAAELAKKEQKREEARPRTSQYSAETGRLIPPPSRAMSRGASRASQRDKFLNKLQHISEEPDMENMVLQMLCQVLQTDDVNAVQAWLVSAGDREKTLVLDMIKAALSSNEEYYKQNTGAAEFEERPKTSQAYLDGGRTIGGGKEQDRLTLDGGSPKPPATANGYGRPGSMMREPIFEEDNDDIMRAPLLPDVFKPPRSAMGSRPGSVGRPMSRTNSRQSNFGDGPKLRYTTTPLRDQNIDSQKSVLNSILKDDNVWEPEKSMV